MPAATTTSAPCSCSQTGNKPGLWGGVCNILSSTTLSSDTVNSVTHAQWPKCPARRPSSVGTAIFTSSLLAMRDVCIDCWPNDILVDLTRRSGCQRRQPSQDILLPTCPASAPGRSRNPSRIRPTDCAPSRAALSSSLEACAGLKSHRFTHIAVSTPRSRAKLITRIASCTPLGVGSATTNACWAFVSDAMTGQPMPGRAVHDHQREPSVFGQTPSLASYNTDKLAAVFLARSELGMDHRAKASL